MPSNRQLFVLLVPLLMVLATSSGGCQKKEPEFEKIRGPQGPVPATAQVMREGVGKLELKAPQPGVLYVYDLDSTRVVYSLQMERNQRFSMDPVKRQTTLDGLPVSAPEFSTQHRHRIYFDRARSERPRRERD